MHLKCLVHEGVKCKHRTLSLRLYINGLCNTDETRFLDNHKQYQYRDSLDRSVNSVPKITIMTSNFFTEHLKMLKVPSF